MENGIAKTLVIIGILVIVVGCITFVAVGSEEGALGVGLMIGGTAMSVVCGIQFIAFGEIVSLLQQSVDKQNCIFDLLNKRVDREASERMDSDELPLQATQSNAKVSAKPESKVPYWCENCGKEGPYFGACPSCGNATIVHEPPNTEDK